MEKEFYYDEFEQLIKEKADQFRMYPSKRVWHSIYNNLHPSRRWPSMLISLLLLTSLMTIGYLNTGDNRINRQANAYPLSKTDLALTNTQNSETAKQVSTKTRTAQNHTGVYDHAFDDVITNETDFYTYTIVKSNRPTRFYNNPVADVTTPAVKTKEENNGKDLIADVDEYLRSNKLLNDVASNKKNKNVVTGPTSKNNNTAILGENTEAD
ncbi:MAG TPA: hypothetical protein VHL77_12555, partial [Ferruginibacter sp.]|nr:hypothetical protein [Ferruginibacter sp.]